MRRRIALVGLFAALTVPTLLVFGFCSWHVRTGSTRHLSGLKTASARVDELQTERAAFQASTAAVKQCIDAQFSFADDAPRAGQRVSSRDALRVAIRYVAPGCTRVSGNIFGYFPSNTPWFDYYCKDCGSSGHINGTIPIDAVILPGESGTVQISAVPGPFPPPNLASPPNLEGFVFCGAVLSFDDGTNFDSSPYEQLDAGCGEPSYSGRHLPDLLRTPAAPVDTP